MGSRIRRGLVALSIAGACAACDGSTSVSGDARLRHHETLADVHEYGVSGCPQDLGELEVELPETAAAPVALAVTEEMVAIDVLDPELGWPINDGYTITIEPGQILVFPVQFNCGATEDVTGSIVLETFSRSGGSAIESASIPITLDIQGGP